MPLWTNGQAAKLSGAVWTFPSLGWKKTAALPKKQLEKLGVSRSWDRTSSSFAVFGAFQALGCLTLVTQKKRFVYGEQHRFRGLHDMFQEHPKNNCKEHGSVEKTWTNIGTKCSLCSFLPFLFRNYFAKQQKEQVGSPALFFGYPRAPQRIRRHGPQRGTQLHGAVVVDGELHVGDEADEAGELPQNNEVWTTKN